MGGQCMLTHLFALFGSKKNPLNLHRRCPLSHNRKTTHSFNGFPGRDPTTATATATTTSVSGQQASWHAHRAEQSWIARSTGRYLVSPDVQVKTATLPS